MTLGFLAATGAWISSEAAMDVRKIRRRKNRGGLSVVHANSSDFLFID
jgi:hypothetical protein